MPTVRQLLARAPDRPHKAGAVEVVVVDEAGDPSDGEPPEGEPPEGEPPHPGSGGLPRRVMTARQWVRGDPVSGVPVGVVNLCRDLSTYSMGFHVSLLATARGLPVRPAQADLAGLRRRTRRPRGEALGILTDPVGPLAPSDERGLAAFVDAGVRAGLKVEVFTPDQPERLEGLAAMLVRASTASVGPASDLVRQADALGIALLEPPEVLLRCCSKAFQAERFAARGVPTPRTVLATAQDLDRVERALGYPCVLKFPDSFGARDVVRVDDRAALQAVLAQMTTRSAVVVAQAWTPTAFDWRIGTLDGQPLFASRYHMVPGHWQIHLWEGGECRGIGPDRAVPFSEVPPAVLRAALRAAAAVRGGLLGVDVKQVGDEALVIEINDTPTVFPDDEDAFIGEALYDRTIAALMGRLGRGRGTLGGGTRPRRI